MFNITKKRSNKIAPEKLDGNDPIQARILENLITIKKSSSLKSQTTKNKKTCKVNYI